LGLPPQLALGSECQSLGGGRSPSTHLVTNGQHDPDPHFHRSFGGVDPARPTVGAGRFGTEKGMISERPARRGVRNRQVNKFYVSGLQELPQFVEALGSSALPSGGSHQTGHRRSVLPGWFPVLSQEVTETEWVPRPQLCYLCYLCCLLLIKPFPGVGHSHPALNRS
jgi:hypothetical protein